MVGALQCLGMEGAACMDDCCLRWAVQEWSRLWFNFFSFKKATLGRMAGTVRRMAAVAV